MSEQVREPGRERSRRRFIKGVLGGGVGATMAVAAGGSPLSAQVGSPIRAFDHVSLPMRNTDAMLHFYQALGLPVNEGPQICSVHLGDQKINLHRPAVWQSESFTLRAPAAEPPCGDFCVVWDGTVDILRDLSSCQSSASVGWWLGVDIAGRWRLRARAGTHRPASDVTVSSRTTTIGCFAIGGDSGIHDWRRPIRVDRLLGHSTSDQEWGS